MFCRAFLTDPRYNIMYSNYKLLCVFCFFSITVFLIMLLYAFDYELINATEIRYEEGRRGDYIFKQANPKISKNTETQNRLNIAIGCAITSHGENHLTTENIAFKLPLLKSLAPSFCRTASAGFNYHFYVSYDVRDQCFSKREYITAIYKAFNEIIEICPPKSNISLYFVRCNHNKNPAWAQNDAMMEAYLDHMDYYYRVNDDTKMLSPGWTEAYIESLKSFDPPNVGVVGPLHRGGNEEILTYDFVHRTHIDIFGSYYPREFTDWWADNWMSSVYGESRTIKLPNVRLVHTSESGTRYNIRPDKDKFLKRQVQDDQAVLVRYLKALKENSELKLSGTKLVISMSLWGTKTRYTYGALRNSQLLSVYFPQWTLRMYVEKPRADGTTSFPSMDGRILLKLQLMGVEIIQVDHQESLIPPMMWRFLVVDDQSVDAFIVRDCDCRLSDRDVSAISDWLTNSVSPFHCARDHPNHAGYAVLGGLWGGKPREMRKFMNSSWHDLMVGLRTDYSQDMVFLSSTIWPIFEGVAYCHDSFSCKKWANAHPFPAPRFGTEHLGQVFDAFGNVKDEDVDRLLESPVAKDCLPVQIQNKDGSGLPNLQKANT